MTDKGRTIAVIPVRERDAYRDGDWIRLRGKPLLDYTIEAAKAASRVSRIVLTTESERVAARARELGAEVPFLRPMALCSADISLADVMRHCVDELASTGSPPRVVVLLEITHPVRPTGLIDKAIDTLETEQLDTVFTVFESRHVLWRMDANGALSRVQADSEDAPRSMRSPVFGQIQGLVCATTAETIRRGAIIGERVAVVPVRGLLGLLDVKDADGLRLAELFLERQ